MSLSESQMEAMSTGVAKWIYNWLFVPQFEMI